MIKMNIPVIFQFLKDLSANNNREWFNEHKAEYETARAEFDNFLATVIARISLFDETIRGIQPKDCTYRIYRDTRFSADKTPYKIHFGGYINAKGKKSDHCGYYVHLQPDGSMLAGGSLCLPPNILKAVRQSIYDNIEEFVAIVEDPEFKKYFPVIGEDFLKTAPKGFLVVLPGEIIEIPQDSGKSWLTLFYSLPREIAEKWKPAYELPRCPYEVLRTDKYDHIVCDDMFKLLVWDCYAWSAWQFFQVKDRKGNYRDIPGSWNQYAGYFPLWRLSYSIIPYIRMKFEQNGLGFQSLYNVPQGVEVPWLTYQQFGNLIGNVTDMIITEQNWQSMIDAIWENRTVEDYETTSSTVKTDFMRKWHHNRSGKPISLDEMMENEDGDIFEVADPRGEFEQKIISEMQVESFSEQNITEKDREILKLRMEGYTEQEIADKVGYKTASAVHKRIAKIAGAYEDYVTAEYQKYLDK